MTRERVSFPPDDEESFREALTLLLVEAQSRDISISDRSWKCNPEAADEKWDIEIFRLSKDDDS